MSDIKYIENENEVEEAIAGGGNVVLLFSAPWCGPCKAVKSRIQQVLNTPKHQDIVCLGVDVDEFPDLASKYVIRSVPTIKCFSAGDECGGSKGLLTSGQIDEMFTGFKKVHAKEPEACDNDESETVAEPSQEEAERTIEEICTEYGLTRLGLFKRLLIAGEESKAEFRDCLANGLGCSSVMPEDPKADAASGASSDTDTVITVNMNTNADNVSASSLGIPPLTLIVGETRIQVSVRGDVACSLRTGDKDAQHFCETSRGSFPKFIERVRRDAVVCYLESQLRNMNSSDKKEHEPEQQMGLSAINDAVGRGPTRTSGYMQPRSQGKTFSVPGLHVYKAKPRTVTAVQCGADNFEAMRALAGVRIMEGHTNAFARFLNEASVVVDVKPGWWLVRRDDTPAIITLIPDEAFRTTYDLCDWRLEVDQNDDR